MKLIEFLTSQREEYLKGLKTLYERLETAGQQAFVETIELREGEGESDNMLFDFFRYDILVKSDDNDDYFEMKVNVNPSTYKIPMEFNEGRLEILLESFVWNACLINCSTLVLDMKLIRAWYLKWIRPNENFFEIKAIGVIHSVTIQSDKSEKEIGVDFGSAPVAAVLELFSILAKANIDRVFIKSGYI
jgi:hypothetical protein